MIAKIQQRHDVLLKKLAEQSEYIDQKVDDWKFSYPEQALYIETKKRTIEKTLNYVTQALDDPESIEDLEALSKKLDDVESVFASLQHDFKPRWRKMIEIPAFLLLITFLMRSFIFSVPCITSATCEPTLLIGDRAFINKIAYEFAPIKHGDLVFLDAPDIPLAPKWSKNYIWQRVVGSKFEPLNLPEGPKTTILRVIAVPGDVIEGKIEHGAAILYLNGKKLNEPYLNPYPLIASQQKNGAAKTSAKFFPLTFNKQATKKSVTWSTYVPTKSLEEQPFYRLTKENIPVSSITGKPFFKDPKTASPHDSFEAVQVPTGHYWCLGDNRKNSVDSRTWGLIDEHLIRGRVQAIMYSIDTQESTWVLDIIKDPVQFCSKKLRTSRFLKKI